MQPTEEDSVKYLQSPGCLSMVLVIQLCVWSGDLQTFGMSDAHDAKCTISYYTPIIGRLEA